MISNPYNETYDLITILQRSVAIITHRDISKAYNNNDTKVFLVNTTQPENNNTTNAKLYLLNLIYIYVTCKHYPIFAGTIMCLNTYTFQTIFHTFLNKLKNLLFQG